jgi:hypothetical protein
MAEPNANRVSAWTVFGAVAFTVALVRLDAHRTPWSQDEADLVRAALAMSEHAIAWLRPTYHPQSADAFTRLGDGIVAPPLASGLMAVPSLLGFRSPAAWPVLGASIFFAGIVAVTRALTPIRLSVAIAAVATSLCLAPRLLLDILALEAEVPLTGFALGALACALARSDKHTTARAALSGALLGAAFLCKLWLVTPIALATALVWLTRRPQSPVRLLATMAGAFLATASLHLVFIAVVDPASLVRWLREVYFAPFGLAGPGSTKWSGVTAHPEWSHGAWYYPAAIARELGLAVLFAPLAAYRLLRADDAVRRRGTTVALVGVALGVALLSVPKIKEPLYVLPAIGLLVAFAAHGLTSLTRARRGWLPAVAVALVAVGIALTRTVPEAISIGQ